MTSTARSQSELGLGTQTFYKRTLSLLLESKLPFMLGGAYALSQYMEFERHTRDLDVFVYRKDAQKILDVLSKAGYKTEMLFPHWLGKAYSAKDYIDIIFSSGNGISEVDDVCFEHAQEAVLLGIPVMVLPPEEIIWSKAFIMERERFDGADIAHLLRACCKSLNWKRMLERFDTHWRVLLSHLILFGFIYPNHRNEIPKWVMKKLLGRAMAELESPAPSDELICQGTLLSRAQYLVDTDNWGYADARLSPRGNMNAKDIAHWTAAIERD